LVLWVRLKTIVEALVEQFPQSNQPAFFTIPYSRSTLPVWKSFRQDNGWCENIHTSSAQSTFSQNGHCILAIENLV
jgi:hypothetical protein